MLMYLKSNSSTQVPISLIPFGYGLQRLKPNTTNTCWRIFRPKFVNNLKDFSSNSHIVKDIVKLTRDVGDEGLDSISEDEVEEVTEENFSELTNSASDDVDDLQEEEDVP